jgi:hypothetical protein
MNTEINTVEELMAISKEMHKRKDIILIKIPLL